MATADEIRAEIAAEQIRLAQARNKDADLLAEITRAEERQCLRRELDDLKQESERLRYRGHWLRMRRDQTDQDKVGPYTTGAKPRGQIEGKREQATPTFSTGGSEISCNDDVARGEYVWRIGGMTWLKHGLAQSEQSYARSATNFRVGEAVFDFVYHPEGGSLPAVDDSQLYRASLAIRHHNGDSGATFKYRIFIQHSDGQFVQWGPQGDEINMDVDIDEMLFGPDVEAVEETNVPAKGIFGLTHEELLQSEWVKDDRLTVKFELQVRCHTDTLPVKSVVQVPPPSISSSLSSFFEEGRWTDVTFLVKQTVIKAHSQMLCARSEVFEKLLHGSMHESVTKEVIIEDCEPRIFTAMLEFVYTDDFSHIQDKLKRIQSVGSTGGSESSTGATGEDSATSYVALLQDVLFVSHKYQVLRLSLWCEQQLCDHIAVTDVCSLLCQAHLCEAKHLEEGCLKCIRDNIETLLPTPEFAHLTATWPEVFVKVGLFGYGFSASASECLRKRKRE